MDDGLSDAACRTLSGERSLRGLPLDAVDGRVQLPHDQQPPLSAAAVDAALANIDQVGGCPLAYAVAVVPYPHSPASFPHDHDTPTGVSPWRHPLLPACLSCVRVQCVVALAETWTETARAIVHRWFPWVTFEDYTIFRTRLLLGVRGGRFVDKLKCAVLTYSTGHIYPPLPSSQTERERAMALRPELVDVILSENQSDVRLYQKMQALHDRQLLVLHTPAFEL